MSASPLVLPPVRLLPVDDLARLALAVPLLDRALRLTRWAAPHRAVDALGELLEEELPLAAAELGLADSGEEGLADTLQAWGAAIDTGLLALEFEEGAEESTPLGDAAGRAVQGETYARVEDGDPREIVDLWLAAAEFALAEAAAPDFEGLPDEPADADQETLLEALDWDSEEEAEFLDSALANLYALMAMDDGTGELSTAGSVPLPVLAASLVVPDEMEQPSDAVLEEVTEVMMRLDDHFRLLAPTGLLEYEPVDEALIEEEREDQRGDGQPGGRDGAGSAEEVDGRRDLGDLGDPGDPGDLDGLDGLDELDADEISRYGLVRLTPLGVHGLRERLADAGALAPALGDLAGAPAEELLDALTDYPDHSARAEAELWLTGRKPADAARELLAAGRGDDPAAPGRRLMCQQTLALLGAEAEPAVREVLDDRRLGGLARVWLTEHGAADIPAPGADMVFWLTIDTLAAQLAADDSPELLAELVRDLVARHDGFFEQAWRVDHPATADVLEAMGRLHPDRKAAKDARKAAFKARSREGGAN